MASVVSGGFFLHNNTSEFLHSTVQTTLDGSVPLSEVFFPSVVVCNINQIRKSFFAELGFYENDTLVRIMYEDFIKGTMDSDWEASEVTYDPKRDAFYEVSASKRTLAHWSTTFQSFYFINLLDRYWTSVSTLLALVLINWEDLCLSFLTKIVVANISIELDDYISNRLHLAKWPSHKQTKCKACLWKKILSKLHFPNNIQNITLMNINGQKRGYKKV